MNGERKHKDINHIVDDTEKDRIMNEIKQPKAIEPSNIKQCQGRNCGCIDGISHSDGCKEDYSIACGEKEILNECGNAHPDIRYLGYTNEPLHTNASDSEKLAWRSGNEARISPSMKAIEPEIAPLATPLPCDIAIDAGTVKKGARARVLVTRMNVLHKMDMSNDGIVSTEHTESNQELVQRLRDACEGELEGVVVDIETSKRILDYVLK